MNVNYPGAYAYNQNGINDLLILEIPAEFDFKIRKTPLGTCKDGFLVILPTILMVLIARVPPTGPAGPGHSRG